MSAFDTRRLGRRLRTLRVARGLTLKAIERAVSVSATHVSEIERGKTTPTVGTLEKIASALGVGITTLLESDAEEQVRVVRADRALSVSLDSGAVELRAFSSGAMFGSVTLMEMCVPPGESFQRWGDPQLAEDVVVLLGGLLEVESGDVKALLTAGDVVHLRTRAQLRMMNPGNEQARALWYTTPRVAL